MPHRPRPAVLLLCAFNLLATTSGFQIGTARATTWTHATILEDGRFNNAATVRVAPDDAIHTAHKWQIDVNSNTRQIAHGTDASGSWIFESLTSVPSSKEYPHLDLGGGVHVVWRQHLGSGNWQLFYSNNTSGSFFAPRQLTFDAHVKGTADIAVDSDEMVHIAYFTMDSGSADDEIYYMRYDAAADTAAVVQVTSDGQTDIAVALALAPDGTVHLAWIAGSISSGALRCAAGDLGGFLDIPTGVTSNAAQPSLGVDGSGHPHVAYRRYEGSGLRSVQYIAHDGNGFGAPLPASPSDTFYSGVALALDGAGAPHVSYYSNYDGHEGVYHAGWSGDAFATPDTLIALTDISYNETALHWGGSGLLAVVHNGAYVSNDTVRANLYLHTVALPTTAIASHAAPRLTGVIRRLENRPNPFNPATQIVFELATAGDASLEVVDVHGRRVARLLAGHRRAGTHQLDWHAGELPSGVYWLRLTLGGEVGTRRAVLLR